MNRPLQKRAGQNNPSRTGSGFSVEVVQTTHIAKRIKSSPFVLLQAGSDEHVILIGMLLTIGALTNNTLAPIDVELWLIDAEGREIPFTGPGSVPPVTSVPIIMGFFPQVCAWMLAPGERVELRITAGDPNVVDGFWFWANKQVIAHPHILIRRVLKTTDFEVVVEPTPGVSKIPPGFVFEGPFVGMALFNYSSEPTTADVTMETEDGDYVLAVGVPVAPNAATPLLETFAGGWGISDPQKLKVRLGFVPTTGDVVYAGCFQVMDIPSSGNP